MLKKITLIIIAIVLMMNIFTGVIYATENTEETATEEVTTEGEVAEGATENSDAETNLEIVKAKVTEAGEVQEATSGSLEDTTQELTVEILEGENEGEKLTVTYTLSYDSDNKIIAYELGEGDKVTVELSTDSEGNLTGTVYDVQRGTFIYIILAILVISIIVIGGLQGVRAVIGVVITLLTVYFILIKGIFAGYNPMLVSIFASAIIIFFTLIVTKGIKRKTFTAILRKYWWSFSGRYYWNYI